MKKRWKILIGAVLVVTGCCFGFAWLSTRTVDPSGFDYSYGSPFVWCYYFEGGRISWKPEALFADIAIWFNVFAIVLLLIYMIMMALHNDDDDEE